MGFLGKKKSDQVKSGQIDTRVFSVLLSEKTVQTLFWQVIDNRIEIVSESALKFYFDENDSLIKLDECLQEMGEESETVTQALFHLDASFIDQDGLLPEKKDLLKYMNESLNLKPVGFAANIEALIQIIQKDVPKKFNLVLEFTEKKIEFSLYQGSSLVENLAVPVSGDSNADLQIGWQQVRGSLHGVAPEEDLSVLYVSSILKKSDLLNRSESFPVKNLESEFLGSEEILEKVVPPAAVALAKERGWLELNEQRINNERAVEAEDGTAALGMAEMDREKEDGEWDGQEANDEKMDRESEETPEQAALRKKKNKWLLIGGIVLGLITVVVIVFAMIMNTTSATVFLTPKTQNISKIAEISIDPSLKTSDLENLILAGELLDQEFNASSAASTTGKKKVGENASGKVEIANKESTDEKKFEKGTVLTTADGKKFTLNDEITVGGAKREEKDGKVSYESAKKEAAVTATEVGEEGNIKNGSKLKVANYDSSKFEATAIADFTGGSSREVKVVTSTDQKKLQDAMMAEMLKTAEQEISAKAENGRYFIPLAKSATATAKKWSHDLDQETDELGLNMTINVPVVAYNSADLKPLAAVILAKEMPEGFVMAEADPALMSSAIGETKKGEKVKLKVDISNQAVAVVETEGLAGQLKGLEEQVAESVLKTKDGIGGVEIVYSNPIFARFSKKLPGNAEKITVEVR